MAQRRIRLEEQDEPGVTPRNKLQKLTEEGVLMQAEASSSQVGELAALKKWLATVRPELPKYKEQMSEEAYERSWEEEDDGKEDWSDPEVVYADRYRDYWNHVWAGAFGSFEDVIKVAAIKDSLQWPLDVYGFVAARDFLDQNRNIIFSRSRDNCQTITEEDSYLELTGPTRALVLLDLMRFEVGLKVKGTNESEDKDLSILAVPFLKGFHTCVVNEVYSSRLSSLELTFGHLVRSVEATISLKVLSGSWPDGFRGIFAASTASIDDKEVLLLAFEDGKLPVTHDGLIQLSRSVACVELKGELKVSVVARCQDEDRAVERHYMVFTPKEAGISSGILKVSSCEMEVIVAWSLLSSTPFFRNIRKKNNPME